MTTRSRICSVGSICKATLGEREGPKTRHFYLRLSIKETKAILLHRKTRSRERLILSCIHLYLGLLCCYAPATAFVPTRLFCQANGPEAFSLPILPPPHASRGMTLNKAAAANRCLPLLLFVSVSSKSPTPYPVATVRQRGTGLRQKYSNIHYTKSIPAA